MGSTADGNSIDLYPCNDVWGSQLWAVEADGTIRDQNMCLDAPGTANETDYFEQQGTVSFPGAGAYLSDISNTYAKQSTFLNGAFDDESWWALAWLNAYKLTGYTNYLTLAENLFCNINQNGWDGTCNGGVWQNGLSAHQKDVIVNELYIELAAGLYRATGDQGYLDLNQFGFLWDSFKTSMLNMTTQGSALEALNANMDSSYAMCR